MTSSLTVRGGQILAGPGRSRGDLHIRDGRVVSSAPGPAGSPRELDARNCLILPGAVDAHTHFGIRMGRFQARDDWRSGPAAAVRGGITTVVDFLAARPGQPLLEAAEERVAQLDRIPRADYSFHLMVNGTEPGLLRQLPGLARAGWPSLKVFTTYRDRGLMIQEPRLRELLGAAGSDLVVSVHCEDDQRVTTGTLREGRRPGPPVPFRLARARPPEAEALAVTRVTELAQAIGGRIHVVHLSAPESLIPLRRAREAGARVTAETCPQYLLLSRARLRGRRGARYACCPPLRADAGRLDLWSALGSGLLDMVATDHCAFTAGQKDRPGRDFRRIPYGLPGVETLLPLVAAGARSRGLSWEQVVELVSTAPARIFGLYPRKGCLLPGSDADLVVLEPEPRGSVDHHRLSLPLGWNPFQGLPVQGRIRHVLRRGEILVQDGEPVGPPGGGRWIPRHLG